MRLRPIFGPILGWEMTVLVRRRRYYFLRALYCLLLLFVLWTIYESTAARYNYGSQSTIERASEFAAQFFAAFTFTQITVVLLLTPSFVATAITVEKEQRTLDYLFASDLTNREIVLGKWAARNLNLFMLVLAGVPILSVAMFFGGISFERLVCGTAIAVSTQATCATIAMLVSIYSRQVRQALISAYVCVIIWLATPILAIFGAEVFSDSFNEGTNLAREYAGVTFVTNPYFTWSPLAGNGSPPLGIFGPLTPLELTVAYVAIQAVATIIGLTWAVLAVRRVYLQTRSAGERTSWLPWKRRERATRTVYDWPMLWKEWNFDSRPRSGIGAKLVKTLRFIIVYGTPIWILSESGDYDIGEHLNIFVRSVGTVVIGLFYLSVAIQSAGCIGFERDRDCWISLMTSPLTGAEIIIGKAVGAVKEFRSMLLLFAPVWILTWAYGGLAPAAIPILLLVVACHALFIVGVGIRQSLLAKTTSTAIITTMITCALLGGIGQIFGMMIFIGGSGRGMEEFYFSTFPWTSLVMAAFRVEDIRGIHSDAWTMIFWCTMFTLGYGASGLLLLQHSIYSFDLAAGRAQIVEDERSAQQPVQPEAVSTAVVGETAASVKSD